MSKRTDRVNGTTRSLSTPTLIRLWRLLATLAWILLFAACGAAAEKEGGEQPGEGCGGVEGHCFASLDGFKTNVEAVLSGWVGPGPESEIDGVVELTAFDAASGVTVAVSCGWNGQTPDDCAAAQVDFGQGEASPIGGSASDDDWVDDWGDRITAWPSSGRIDVAVASGDSSVDVEFVLDDIVFLSPDSPHSVTILSGRWEGSVPLVDAISHDG